MIVVTGATGNVGGELVSALAAQGRPVRAVAREPERVTRRAGVEVVAGDLNRPDSLKEALTGARSLFLLGGFPDMPGVLAQARAAGVAHVVLLSSRSVVGGRPDNAVVAMHLTGEAALRESGPGWTVLRPSGFMSNTFEWREPLLRGDVTIRSPFADVPIAAIDPFDIAAAAAAVLGDEEHFGRAYSLSGPAALLPADRLAVLAELLGRPLRLEAVPDDVAREEMSRTTPARYVDAFFRFFSDGEFDDTAVLPTVAELTGRPPRSFRGWAREHLAEFRR
ncbi:NAD(P)H-binding protein [Kitasatospora sp. McL0602]|uniref:NAD(P)H-binding protein n=1 Tax=Kitasatospora sp. McL0602 TaxID=3439530 RepID=UPI003F8986F8